MSAPNPIAAKLVHNSARMAAVNDRFSEWAAGCGVRTATVNHPKQQRYLEEENDALAAHLYGLDPDDLDVLFETFDHKRPRRYAERKRRVAAHWLRIAAHVEAGRDLVDLVRAADPKPRCRLVGPLDKRGHGNPIRHGLCHACLSLYWRGPTLAQNCRKIIDRWEDTGDPEMVQEGMFGEPRRSQSRPAMADFEAWLEEPCEGLVGSPLWGIWRAAMELRASGLMGTDRIFALPVRCLEHGYAIPELVEAYYLRPVSRARCPRCGQEAPEEQIWNHKCAACGFAWRPQVVPHAELDATGDKHLFVLDGGASSWAAVR